MRRTYEDLTQTYIESDCRTIGEFEKAIGHTGLSAAMKKSGFMTEKLSAKLDKFNKSEADKAYFEPLPPLVHVAVIDSTGVNNIQFNLPSAGLVTLSPEDIECIFSSIGDLKCEQK